MVYAVLAGSGARALLPLCAALLCFVFAGLLFRQWLQRHRPYQVIWAVGLLCYAIASGADATGQLAGWSELTYRIWYFFGAVAAAAWLGLGELYLMPAAGFGELVALGVFAGAIPAVFTGGRMLGAHLDAPATEAVTIGIVGIAAAGILALVSWERPALLGHVGFAFLAAGTVFAATRVFGVAVDPAAMVDPATGIPHGEAFPQSVRLLTPLFNIGGALALLFGAVYSAWTYWRRGASRQRLVSNSLIALGAFAPSLTSSLNRFGVTAPFYVGELLGVLLIFAGFLASHEVFARRATGRSRSPVSAELGEGQALSRSG
jgi:hypothetical protein